ncbi:hypothetical protein OQJ18_13605 [Fluoribacter dumoffii]|uniref:Uncharacterized protein n=1 Tax=Fluoribacter dumoffii TaxID=463 RepID=A0A377GDV6_9GAMM|nr:hypothetical protein [Fluoribacter dumoffii]KTC91247.1 hypothetical protein Ldum_2315 [Fluoribacter dumoffii NY 23]MCW8387587.1 hypothetical protein [Fluoribacter dumoffii]MCW8416868.1 hypothetical protein [Fluoribacter dumoffii]MCW8455292.1 hypothetical protein [Fluoribacter dumoffii]MCW8460630.1 hypothetical protein [Fluoribacter dumoffii]
MNKNNLSFYLSIFLASSSVHASSETLKETPFGLRPSQCIHTHPSGTTIREKTSGVEAIYPDGSIKQYPKDPVCMKYHQDWLDSSPRFNDNKTDLKNGWLDNAWWFTPSPAAMLSGNYWVPSDPAAGRKTYWLYYFLGLENIQSNVPVSILQPVLSWSSSGWKFTSWNCCPEGQVHKAASVPTKANSVVHGEIQQQGSIWIIDAIAAGEHSTLKVEANNRVFNYVDATLETYNVADCTYFPSTPLTYSQILLILANGKAVTPTWKTTGATQCSGSVTVASPSKIVISHN